MALLYLSYIYVIFTYLYPNIDGVPLIEQNDAVKISSFFEHFGYLEKNSELRKDESALNNDELENAIKTFQNFTHLNVTGELDNATIDQMNKPRCGLPDIITHDSNRYKRYVVHTYKWAIKDLHYRIEQYSSQLSVNETNHAISNAFQLWSSAAEINFTRSTSSPLDPVNIRIGFYTGDHGDKDPFDGEGGTLAHAFFPPYGDLHFDDAENFTLNSVNGTNFLTVTVHELGHSLGLEHSSVPGAVMNPYYQPYDPNTVYKLHADDIAGIQFLYGVRGSSASGNSSNKTPSGTPAWRFPGTEICQSDSIDAIYHDSQNDLTTIFKGSKYWVMDYYGVKIGYPKFIKLTWPPLPTNIDATLYWPAYDQLRFPPTVFIFKDNTVYRMINNIVVTAEPISRAFPGLPNSIDSAIAVSKDNLTYFTRGLQIYSCKTYDMQSLRNMTETVTKWRVSYADGAVNYKGHMYIFVRGIYYGYDNNEQLMGGYPKSLQNDWYGCTGNIPREEERDRNSADKTTSRLSLIIILHLLVYLQTKL